MLIKTKFNVGEVVSYNKEKYVVIKIEVVANDFNFSEIRYDLIKSDIICKSILEENIKKIIKNKSVFEI